ncbi:CoA transferase [uncultured Sneathiella sp.]|uniref:CaiB/BaiF CoA transferase family protein n=1 Tax=uncultured Sneathiella sp. TaxID=879315 RepID=UPI0030ECAA25|tara:strand:+ start:58286 stop:59437 length:1152 start_codon:yes stop_codon:yes gene_type:complete
MSGSLIGIKVLDFTQMMAGPLCSMTLGDMGATVIKVEPETGDTMRETGQSRYLGESEYFLGLNRNKRSLALDLKKPENVRIIQDLAKDADVVLENFRPGTAERMGLGYDILKQNNPRLIYCSMSGFGSNSIYGDKPSLDPIIQALSGLMDLNGTKETGPLIVASPYADFLTPMMAVIAILSALNARHGTGEGQKVEVDMLKSTIFGMKPREQYTLLHGQYPQRSGNESAQIVPYNTYGTSDKRSLTLIAHNDKYWQGLRRCLEVEQFSNGKRFGTTDLRLERREEVDELISTRIAQESLAYWEDKFSSDNVLFGPVRTLEEALNMPEIREAMVHETEFQGGKIPILGIPIFHSKTPNDVRLPPPLLGEANAEVLLDGGAKWPD